MGTGPAGPVQDITWIGILVRAFTHFNSRWRGRTFATLTVLTVDAPGAQAGRFSLPIGVSTSTDCATCRDNCWALRIRSAAALHCERIRGRAMKNLQKTQYYRVKIAGLSPVWHQITRGS